MGPSSSAGPESCGCCATRRCSAGGCSTPSSPTSASWPTSTVRPVRRWSGRAVKIDVDLTAGLHASAGDVTVHITGVLDRRRLARPGPPARRRPLVAVHVYAPCRSARIEVAHSVVPGTPRIKDGPPVGSSALLAVAETWARSDPAVTRPVKTDGDPGQRRRPRAPAAGAGGRQRASAPPRPRHGGRAALGRRLPAPDAVRLGWPRGRHHHPDPDHRDALGGGRVGRLVRHDRLRQRASTPHSSTTTSAGPSIPTSTP